jgi:shikimate kinase
MLPKTRTDGFEGNGPAKLRKRFDESGSDIYTEKKVNHLHQRTYTFKKRPLRNKKTPRNDIEMQISARFSFLGETIALRSASSTGKCAIGDLSD